MQAPPSHILLRHPRIIDAITKSKRSDFMAQILQFLKYPDDDSPHALVVLSDSFHSVKTVLNPNAIEKFRKEQKDMNLTRLKGSIVSIQNFDVILNELETEFFFVVDSFKFVGSEGSFPFGSPRDVHFEVSVKELLNTHNESKQESSVDMSGVKDLLSLCDFSQSQGIETEEIFLKQEDCEIPESQLEALDNIEGWSPQPSSIRSSPSTNEVTTDYIPPSNEDFYSGQEPLEIERDDATLSNSSKLDTGSLSVSFCKDTEDNADKDSNRLNTQTQQPFQLTEYMTQLPDFRTQTQDEYHLQTQQDTSISIRDSVSTFEGSKDRTNDQRENFSSGHTPSQNDTFETNPDSNSQNPIAFKSSEFELSDVETQTNGKSEEFILQDSTEKKQASLKLVRKYYADLNKENPIVVDFRTWFPSLSKKMKIHSTGQSSINWSADM